MVAPQDPRAGPSARGSDPREGHDGTRGQTSLDFAIGVTIFLSVVVFVFAFVPGILQPFDLSGEQNVALSDRVATSLSQGLLGNASEPYTLESHCTVQFFDLSPGPPGRCAYEGADLTDRVGVDDRYNLNVTIEGDLPAGSGHLCWDAGSEDLVLASDAACDQPLIAGSDPPSRNVPTVTARRVVSLHQQNVTLQVVAW